MGNHTVLYANWFKVDMAILVEAQGEMLNQIEYNVSQSVAYTAKGVEELKGAVKQQKKGRKVWTLRFFFFRIFSALFY